MINKQLMFYHRNIIILGSAILFLFANKPFMAQTPEEDFSVKNELEIKTHNMNGSSYASDVVSYNNKLYFAYISEDQQGMILQKLSDGTIHTAVVINEIKSDDHHVEPSIQVDNDGYIHYTANMHHDPMNYHRSVHPEDISSWEFLGNDTTKGGILGKYVTYARFVKSRKGTLFLLFRSRIGNINNGWVPGIMGGAVARYHTGTKKWSRLGTYNFSTDNIDFSDANHQRKVVIWDNSGAGTPGGNAYQGYKLEAVFDKDNRMHLAWNVMKNPSMEGFDDVSKAATHVMYAYSDDEGDHWHRMNGDTIDLPITTENGEVVYQDHPDGRMTNTLTMSLTNDDRPIIRQRNDKNGVSVDIHVWNGSSWERNEMNFPSSWISRGCTDFKGIITAFPNGKDIERSWDNGNTWQHYELPEPYTYNVGNMSIDMNYIEHTGKIRILAHPEPELAQILTLDFSGSLPPLPYDTNKIAMPGFSPIEGPFPDSTTITLSCASENVTIKYTLDGSAPSDNNGIVYNSPFTIKESVTIKAMAIKPGKQPGDINEATYSKGYSLDISTVNGMVIPDTGLFSAGDTVTLQAVPYAGYNFTSWSGDYNGTDHPLTIVMDSSIRLTAHFESTGYPLISLNKPVYVSAEPQSDNPGSHITDGYPLEDFRWSAEGYPQWAEIDLGKNYHIRQTDIHALHDRAYQFSIHVKAENGEYYKIADYNNNEEPCNPLSDTTSIIGRYVTLEITDLYDGSSNWVSITEMAIFGEDVPMNTYELTSTTENGEIIPGGGTFAEGSQVNLTVIPGENHVFKQWDGDIAGEAVPYILSMDSNVNISAIFKALPEYTLTVNAENGDIVMSPEDDTFVENTEVTVEAQPHEGFLFDSWEGDISSTENPLTIVITDHLEITAIFVEDTTNYIHNKSNTEYSIYPNPVKPGQNLTIKPGLRNGQCFVYTVMGQLIYQTGLHSGNAISVPYLPGGIYYVKLTDGKKRVAMEKLIVR